MSDALLQHKNAGAQPETPRPPRTAHQIRAVAVKAHRDPRTVRAAYAGTATPMSTDAIAEAAIALGFAPPPEGP